MLSNGELWARGSSSARIEEFLRYNNLYRIAMERDLPEKYEDYLHFARKVLRERAERDAREHMRLARWNNERETECMYYPEGSSHE